MWCVVMRFGCVVLNVCACCVVSYCGVLCCVVLCCVVLCCVVLCCVDRFVVGSCFVFGLIVGVLCSCCLVLCCIFCRVAL